MKRFSRYGRTAAAAFALCGLASLAQAQTIDPYYASFYGFKDLGSAGDIPANYGGLLVNPASADHLLLGGSANNTAAAIYSIGVTRDADQHITGFAATADKVSSASGAYGGIDGGLLSAPNGTLLYTNYSSNEIGEIRPGSTSPDKLVGLSALGVSSSVGALAFAPNGHVKIASYNTGDWYDATLSPDGSGTYDLTNVTQKVNLGSSGPEGIIYVPGGSPLFASPSILVSEYRTGNVSSYEVDANGDPVLSTQRTFLTGLTGAEGGTTDPLTGDFLFSTYGGGNHVLEIGGFAKPVSTPAPGALTVALFGAVPGVLALRRRTRRKQSLREC